MSRERWHRAARGRQEEGVNSGGPSGVLTSGSRRAQWRVARRLAGGGSAAASVRARVRLRGRGRSKEEQGGARACGGVLGRAAPATRNGRRPRACRCRRRRAPEHARNGISTVLCARGTKLKSEDIPVREMRRVTRMQKRVFAKSIKVLYNFFENSSGQKRNSSFGVLNEVR